MIKIYGIKNCNTVKNALQFLDDKGIKYQFHDYKKDGVDKAKLEELLKKFGHEILVNRKGTTWRQLSKEEQDKVKDNKSALEIMLQKPSIIKRPILDNGKKQIIGFDVEQYSKLNIY